MLWWKKPKNKSKSDSRGIQSATRVSKVESICAQEELECGGSMGTADPNLQDDSKKKLGTKIAWVRPKKTLDRPKSKIRCSERTKVETLNEDIKSANEGKMKITYEMKVQETRKQERKRLQKEAKELRKKYNIEANILINEIKEKKKRIKEERKSGANMNLVK